MIQNTTKKKSRKIISICNKKKIQETALEISCRVEIFKAIYLTRELLIYMYYSNILPDQIVNYYNLFFLIIVNLHNYVEYAGNLSRNLKKDRTNVNELMTIFIILYSIIIVFKCSFI